METQSELGHVLAPLVGSVGGESCFRLGRGLLDRITFACEFSKPGGGNALEWDAVGCFGSTNDIPRAVQLEGLHKAYDFFATKDLRKCVKNPVLLQYMDARAELLATIPSQDGSGDSGASAWLPDLLACAAKNKLNVSHWHAAPLSFDPARIPTEALEGVARSLSKMWPARAPPWVGAIRERYAAWKQEQAQQREQQHEQPAASGALAILFSLLSLLVFAIFLVFYF